MLRTELHACHISYAYRAWPGMGTWTYQAILGRDYPIVQASVLVSATIYVFINLGVDLLYAVLDPRVRYT